MSAIPGQDLSNLTTGAQRLVELSLQKQTEANQSTLGINHWLLALLERHSPMVSSLLPGVDLPTLQKKLLDQIHNGTTGDPFEVASSVQLAVEKAKARGKMQANEMDLAAVILDKAGLKPENNASTPSNGAASANHVKSATPMLDTFGRDLTQAARDGKLPPLVGRQEEIELVTETLCRTTKRNPALVGPAGVGKTAIIEGLAQKIAEGSAPQVLKDMRIISIQPSNLIVDTAYQGELQKRMQGILKEASQPDIILFIDEVHSIIGAGGSTGATDIASLLKPALARGDIACIAATTDDEYRRFIETDTALERRFQPIRVQELTADQTLQVLKVLRDRMSAARGVQVGDEVLHFLIEFGQTYMRNRHFPDKAVDLLEQCVAHGVANGHTGLQVSDAQEVAQRMVGMPLSVSDRVNALEARLVEQSLLAPEDVRTLVNRLQVTFRGLDLRSARPNAVILLSGEAAENSERLADAVAETLFGSPERSTVIDLSRMVDAESITALLGAPPMYVGYAEALPIHRVAQMPWSVLRLEGIDACHPQIRQVISRALAQGYFTDGRGKDIFLSDTVVILTASIWVEAHRSLGFQTKNGSPSVDIQRAVAQTLGEDLAGLIDLCSVHTAPLTSNGAAWIENELLGGLSRRYLEQGIQLQWDKSLVDWLMTQRDLYANERDWERFVDEKLSLNIIQHLPEERSKTVLPVTVRYDGEKVLIESAPEPEDQEHGI